ncbi:hypothetical protein niasHS_013045 [Heterodera schachtii]|uniref:Uncharacterized protein n=1 Tax=Heterodera schachtii TaxID=97005 RepID=A0ABD2IES5_HETSC
MIFESAPAINSSNNKATKSQGETSSQSEDELVIDQNNWEESISNAQGIQNEIEIEPANSPADNHHHSLSFEHLSNQSPKASASDTVQQTVIGTEFSTPTTTPYNNEIEEVHSTPTTVPYNNEIEEVQSSPSEALSNDSEYPVLGTLSSFLESMFEFIGGTPSTSSPVRASDASTECSVFLPLSPLSKAMPDSSEVEPCPVPSPFADTSPKVEENGNSQLIVGTAHSSPEEMVEEIVERLKAAQSAIPSHETMASSSSEKTMTTARSSLSQLSKSSGQTDETAFFTPDVFSRNSEQIEEIFSPEEIAAENPAESEEKMAKEEAQKTAQNEKQLKKQKSKSRFFCCCK